MMTFSEYIIKERSEFFYFESLKDMIKSNSKKHQKNGLVICIMIINYYTQIIAHHKIVDMDIEHNDCV